MVSTTGEILSESAINPADIKGISFCSQMQGLVLVDSEGNALRNAFSYLDQRATKELREGMAHGMQIEGCKYLEAPCLPLHYKGGCNQCERPSLEIPMGEES
nr:FGGY family carbohydrate kinase [uncultured Sphaerochaeta sp.]